MTSTGNTQKWVNLTTYIFPNQHLLSDMYNSILCNNYCLWFSLSSTSLLTIPGKLLKVTWKRRSMFLPVGQSEARLAGLAQEANWSPRFESATVFLTTIVLCFIKVKSQFDCCQLRWIKLFAEILSMLNIHVKRQRPVMGQATSLTADSPQKPRVLYNITQEWF